MRPGHFFPIALLALSHGAFSQQLPGAGSQLLQIPPSLAQPRPPPAIRIEAETSPAATENDAVRILVRELRVSGSRSYSEADLVARSGFVPGRELALGDLRLMAARITEHYQANGYLVARAYLPAQEVKEGVVTIAVSEGQYGQIALQNTTRLSDRLIRGELQGLNSGDPVVIGPLENRLLLLSDLPGVNVRSTLVPGATPGSSDLLVDVAPGRPVSGSVDIDNAGNPSTGEVRVGATVNLNNPLGLGDVASLRLLTSGNGLRYARGSYQLQVGRGQVGVAYSQLDYRLGNDFESLGAHGTAKIASVYGRYPLVRSRNDNLYVQLGYDAKTFRDQIDAVPSSTVRKARVATASLYGDHSDSLGGGGQSSYGLAWSTGRIDIRTPEALAADEASARSNGRFNKLAFNAARVQQLVGPFSVYGAVNGQIASKNLDPSEKMELGGMNAVRAYPEGEAYADEGYVLTLEGRMQLPGLSRRVPGAVQLVAFVDSGSVKINHSPWAAGDNRRTLSAAGVGLQWGDAGNFMLRTYYARKLGSGKATSSQDKSGRFWIQAVKYF